MTAWTTLPNGSKRAFLTHPTRTFRFPSDWDSAANLVECLGSGAPGLSGTGGGGGAYASKRNIPPVPGNEVDVTIGAGDMQEDTIFGFASRPIVLAAFASDYQGGAADNSLGDVTRSGGNGYPAGGGGGAAGPDADGLSADSEDGAAGNGGGGGAGGISGPGEAGLEWDDYGTGGGGSTGNTGGAYGGGGGVDGEGAPGLIIVTYTPA